MINPDSFEEELKKAIFDRIYEIQDKNQELIANAKTIGRNVGIHAELSNIARTATNKLILDIVPEFKKSGLKFYSDSIVSQAIYSQIIEYIDQGQGILRNYNDNLNPKKSYGQEKQKDATLDEQNSQLKPYNALSGFFANFRKMFARSRKEKNTISSESIEAAKACITEYENLDKQLWKYNLRDNIIPALTQVICPTDDFGYLPTTVPELVDEDIAPVLQKLGLGDLIPKLEDALVEGYIKNEEGRMEHCLSQEEIDLYVPNFKKYRSKKQNKKVTDIEEVESTQMGNEVVAAKNTTIGEGIEPGDD